MSNRLLRAAARGARIQIREAVEWKPSHCVPTHESPAYRVHPEDAHLMYGSLATTIRKHAENPPVTLYRGYNSYVYDAYCRFSDVGDYGALSKKGRVIYLLLLAEFVERKLSSDLLHTLHSSQAVQ